MNTSRLGIIYQHTLVLTMINLCTKFEMRSFNPYDGRPKLKKWSRDPDHVRLGVAYHLKANSLCTGTRIQNLKTLASAVPNIWKKTKNVKTGDFGRLVSLQVTCTSKDCIRLPIYIS